MKSRFKKFWCEGCSSMQFVGSCPHGLQVRPPVRERATALLFERFVGGSCSYIHDREAIVEAGRMQRERIARITPTTYKNP